MTSVNLLCAGLDSSHMNAVCERRQSCRLYANWWKTSGVQFNVCNPTGKPFKFYAPANVPTSPPAQLTKPGQTMDLFA